MMDHSRTPLADALDKQSRVSTVSFDVPGHKGRIPAMTEYFGKRCMSLDKNSRYEIDNLLAPSGAIAQAESLAADAFGAKHAFFMVGGTTSCVQSMIMSVCKPGESILLPRNVHASVLHGIILAGAIPVYLKPGISDRLGISTGVCVSDVEKLILENPEVKAVLINNPTYYGICSDLKKIVEIAHSYGVKVLVDEAHGAHFYFNKNLPSDAMSCGADMSAVSMHKTGGSLTQSSILLINNDEDAEYVREIINLTLTTSSSYLLTSSLDIARSYMATKGRFLLPALIDKVNIVRDKINSLKGFYAFGSELKDGNFVYDFDETKLCVNTLHSGYAGIEIYKKLLYDYDIQLELGDIGNILAIPTVATEQEDFDKLVRALETISEKSTDRKPFTKYEYYQPIVKTSPRDAFFARKKSIPLSECIDSICGEFVMCYPPGIPILAPGELITERAIDHIKYAAAKGCTVTGMSDPTMQTLKVLR